MGACNNKRTVDHPVDHERAHDDKSHKCSTDRACSVCIKKRRHHTTTRNATSSLTCPLRLSIVVFALRVAIVQVEQPVPRPRVWAVQEVPLNKDSTINTIFLLIFTRWFSAPRRSTAGICRHSSSWRNKQFIRIFAFLAFISARTTRRFFCLCLQDYINCKKNPTRYTLFLHARARADVRALQPRVAFDASSRESTLSLPIPIDPVGRHLGFSKKKTVPFAIDLCLFVLVAVHWQHCACPLPIRQP